MSAAAKMDKFSETQLKGVKAKKVQKGTSYEDNSEERNIKNQDDMIMDQLRQLENKIITKLVQMMVYQELLS